MRHTRCFYEEYVNDFRSFFRRVCATKSIPFIKPQSTNIDLHFCINCSHLFLPKVTEIDAKAQPQFEKLTRCAFVNGAGLWNMLEVIQCFTKDHFTFSQLTELPINFIGGHASESFGNFFERLNILLGRRINDNHHFLLDFCGQ